MTTTDAQPQAATFAARLAHSIARQDSLLCVGLDPAYEKLPAEYRTGSVAEDIFAYNHNIIDRAAPFAAAFKPQYKFYSAEGEAGIAALRMTCDYIKANYPNVLLILDAKYSDIGNTLERCAREAYDLFNADAVTAMPAPGKQALSPLFSRPGKGCFMVVRTSNPGAEELQDIAVDGEPLYVVITRKIAAGWNEGGNVGLVGPATDTAVLARIRKAAPDLPILCPGVGAQGGDLEAAVRAGLDAQSGGLLVSVSRGVMEAPDPGDAARNLRDALNEARSRRKAAMLAEKDSLAAEVIEELYSIGAIRFEPVTLKSGLVSPYYNNLRILASRPPLLRKVAALMARTMQEAGLHPDILVGIAHAGVPLAVALSQYTGIPGGYVRAEAKQHGTKRMVEGIYEHGATAVLVDDVVSDGASKLEVLGYLQDEGLKVRDIVVLVDRGQGGPELMERHGLHCHAAVTMETVLTTLHDAGLITQQKVDDSHAFMHQARTLGDENAKTQR